MKNLAFYLVMMLFICSCKKEKIKRDLTGTWVYEYEIMEDGTKKYDTPYALMDFNYSDGFILNNDGSGSTIWYDTPNGDIEWSSAKDKLIIHNQYLNGELTDYEYSIEEVKTTSLMFENYKGKKYYMKKQ